MELFKEVCAFAMQAAQSTRMVDLELIDKAIAEGEQELVPGGRVINLDDALEIEQALREMRALRTYRVELDKAKPSVIHAPLNGGGD
jgi:hypothetical protein